jgi:hypothetical protein
MGAKDVVTKAYMGQNHVFADAFNFYIYGGRQVIDPNSLYEIGTAELTVPYGSDNAEEPVEKVRDVMRSVTAMTDDKNAYLLLGIENQSDVHYAMPVKNMCYDALRYDKQVEQAKQSHRKAKDSRGHSSGEYLSGFYKTDRLIPVITLVMFFGADDWDGPLSLHEMMATQDPEILAMVPDYSIHLIAPAKLTDEEFQKFHSSLKEVLSFIKYSRDKEKLTQLVDNDISFQTMGRKEVDVINICTSAGLTLNENEEVFNVCKAIEDMKKDVAEQAHAEGRVEGRAEGRVEGRAEGRAEGRVEGRAEGRVEGRVEGRAEGRAEGREEGRYNALIVSIKNLMTNLSLTAEQAMTALGIPASDFSKYLPSL